MGLLRGCEGDEVNPRNIDRKIRDLVWFDRLWHGSRDLVINIERREKYEFVN